MRKLVLGLAAVSVMAGAAVYALACDHDKSASNTSLSSASSTSKDGGACASHSLSSASKAGASCGAKATASMSCSDKKNAMASADKHGCSDFAFTIADMRGECCVDKVEKALSMKGVQAVYVDLDNHRAYVCSSKSKIDSKAALKSLKKAGYVEAVYMGADAEHCAHALSSSGEKSCHPQATKKASSKV